MRALWDLVVSAAAFINHLNLVLSVLIEGVIAACCLFGLLFLVSTSQE